MTRDNIPLSVPNSETTSSWASVNFIYIVVLDLLAVTEPLRIRKKLWIVLPDLHKHFAYNFRGFKDFP